MSSIRDFVPLSKLGQGTFSTVYKVRRVSDQKIYALKKVKLNNLSQKQKQNSLNEIRILASFECPNIIAYKEAFFDDKLLVLCIVMEYADGGDLHKYITDTKKNFSVVQEITIWKFVADVLVALEHLHAKGILHRDLKSANVFIHGDLYKLGDLNVSKVNGGRLAYTQTGTPYYASPQVWRDQPYDQKSDIWSFGCIVYELACLKPPFQGRDMDDLFRSIQRCSYPAIPDQYSQELSELVEKCLQKNAKKRPKASELLQHPIIRRFKNRKPTDQPTLQKQLLRTIKLPNDLRSLALNLPTPKYQDTSNPSKNSSNHNPSALNNPKYLNLNQYEASPQKVDIKNYISDRPAYYGSGSGCGTNNNYGSGGNGNGNCRNSGHGQNMRNYSQVINSQGGKREELYSPRQVNRSQVLTSPRNNRGGDIYSASRSPEDIVTRKILSAHINSEKRYNHKPIDYTDRIQSSQNYSQRRLPRKNPILDKYDKFINQELQKKSVGLPRTQKRIINIINSPNPIPIPIPPRSESCSHPPQPPKQIPTTPIDSNPNPNPNGTPNANSNYNSSINGPDRRDIEEWKKKLVKKSRVFSNNYNSANGGGGRGMARGGVGGENGGNVSAHVGGKGSVGNL